MDRNRTFGSIVPAAAVALAALCAAPVPASAQVALSARATTATLPDGQRVPMWGLFCSAGNCTALDGTPQGGTTWRPPLIRARTGDTLTIRLTNGLPAGVPTSLVIVGQLGGGLGAPVRDANPVTHAVQGTTWPAAGDTTGAVFEPPEQAARVRSFGTEVGSGSAAVLTWAGLRAGTYLIESGTHPSIQGQMGLYGVLVVADSATQGYPGVVYDKDVPLLLSEIDAAQNRAVAAAVATPGFSESSIRVLRDLVDSVALATNDSGAVVNAGSGYVGGEPILFTGGGPSATAVAHVSAVDAHGAITAITLDSGGSGYSSVPVASVTRTKPCPGCANAQLQAALMLSGVMCSDAAAACYPPAVNYDPRYYLVNGVAFDKTNPVSSAFAGPTGTATSGNVLLRFVNAGLRMHVPSVVGYDMTLVTEDGHLLPGRPRIQNEVFLAAGKAGDVMIRPTVSPNGTYPAQTAPVFDRQLSLSANNERDGGMLAYVLIGPGAAPPGGGPANAAVARDDRYFLVRGHALTVDEPAQGLIANDTNVYGITVTGIPAGAQSFSWNPDGTFTYTPATGTTTDTFTYRANGAGGPIATVHLDACTSTRTCSNSPSKACTKDADCGGQAGSCAAACLGAAPQASPDAYTSNIATLLTIAAPGVLANDADPDGHPLTAALAARCTAPAGRTCLAAGQVALASNGGFTAKPPAPGAYAFTYHAVNSQGTASADTTVTLDFLSPSNLRVRVRDGQRGFAVTDYRWIIEEDRTLHVDPAQTNNGAPVTNIGTNFHTSYMPVVARGCVGAYSCGSGQTVLGAPVDGETAVDPSQVHLDPKKRYFISILPGDAQNPALSGSGAPVTNADGSTRRFDVARDCPSEADFAPGRGACGHGMSGAPLAPGQATVEVKVLETPFPTAKISVFVFEDDAPLNGEVDAGGGDSIIAPNEPGLDGFAITILDQAGGLGDSTGQPTYDMFNMPLSNALAGRKDALTGLDACPLTRAASDGLVGMIMTCPKYESDGKTLSPLRGQAIIDNLYPGLYEVVATPGADRIARGEQWVQTNTLDGTKPHEAFIRPGEPGYFQEFGPAGYHVTIGFANPAVINGRLPRACATTTCNSGVDGHVTSARTSRTPDERIFGSGTYDSFSFTQCYVSLGDPGSFDYAFTTCDADGKFSFRGIPPGNHKLTILDQWNDIIVDGLSIPVALPSGGTLHMGEVSVMQWRTNLSTKTFLDLNHDGVAGPNEPGLPLVSVNLRYRDGSYLGFNNTDLAGAAGFNEIFPFFNWMVIESDSTRYKQTGVHVVYDAGGPADGTHLPGSGNSAIAAHVANSLESATAHLPSALRVPGAVYCSDADCTNQNLLTNPNGGGADGSTGRIDPAWATSEGWQGFAGHTQFFEFGKVPFAAHENGGIRGHVVYASTRPFDDPQLLLQLSWEPLVPNVTVNLYREGTAADGTANLKLVDSTKTSSWDAWAQGFRSDGAPNMNCPGQETSSPFYFTLKDTRFWLNPDTALPLDSRFKCYDGLALLDQVQPAPYDGMYQFPSVTARDPKTGRASGTNCTGCTTNPLDRSPMLPAGKYVVEVVVPPGYELVKEEDKNILIGDNYIAPVTQQFAGLGNVFILPDQAEVDSEYNPNNAQNSTKDLGVIPRTEGDTGSIEKFWPCVGAERVVPDYLSLFPLVQQVAPFAGATRRLCDRKEITLEDQMTALAKFYVYTPTHIAGHFTGIVTDDYASEFDPFSPSYGEKFAVPNLPVSFKDFMGNEITRTYTDQWGAYDGLFYSTWEVNPPNPTGYGPAMPIACMNDSGVGSTGATDPLYNPGYSQFCYEWSLMPGQTAYMDTPVVPTMAFAEGYNPPDCAYPAYTPAIKRVDGDGIGPWVSTSTGVHSLTITALGDQAVPNDAYNGPQAAHAPFNQKFITRHYGFGSRCTSTGSPGCSAVSSVTIGGVPATITSWSDTRIVVQVPAAVPNCAIQQVGQPAARCGELAITAGNGKHSVDTVTVTIGGKRPTIVSGEDASGRALQNAIDRAAPGDLLIADQGVYPELLIMWKPVRLQGVGAASVTIDASPHPSGKLDPWRRQVGCLFGLALDGLPISPTNPYDPNPVNPFTCDDSMRFRVDRVPFEGIVGWDTTLNGNLAELLQEPTLFGAYEGAGITVVAKGVEYPAGADPFGSGAESSFPVGTRLLTGGHACNGGPNPGAACVRNGDCGGGTCVDDCARNPGNFLCNPSRIDGLTVTDSSQGGGGIFAHGWAHHLEVSNNRVRGNQGTLTGGITIGQGEFGDPNIAPQDATATVPPLPQNVLATVCGIAGCPDGTQLPYWLNTYVSVHDNAVTENASEGDSVYSTTPSGAGGVTFTSGSDYYTFTNNWVCGNLSPGDGGGAAHLGFSYSDPNVPAIAHNTILFNQSQNPTIPTHGGGLLIAGAGPDGQSYQCSISGDSCNPGDANACNRGVDGTCTLTECGSINDVDCAPGLTEGLGPGLVVDANLVQGNTAESGSGGGIRLQLVNGTEVQQFPGHPERWYSVLLQNNIIVNNVAGWDGGGVSMQDALRVSFVNNSVISNDSTASAGVLFSSFGSSTSSVPPGTDIPPCGEGCTQSPFLPAGLVTVRNTPNLVQVMNSSTVCPSDGGAANPYATTGGNSRDACRSVGLPVLANDVFWQNRTFQIQVGGLGTGSQNQQNTVALVPALNQSTTGGCSAGSVYAPGTSPSTEAFWEIGIRGDGGPAVHTFGKLNPRRSILTDAGDYPGASNLGSDPAVQRQYCNGSRFPPESCTGNCYLGIAVPPGVSQENLPNPLFTLHPTATVDEANNWINMTYGPLSLTDFHDAVVLGQYVPTAGAPTINGIKPGDATYPLAPPLDFFGRVRGKPSSPVDIGAVEFPGIEAPVGPPLAPRSTSRGAPRWAPEP